MRDDVFGLAAFRSLSLGAKPEGSPLAKPSTLGRPSFETVLSRATSARSTTRPVPKPYVSPMKAGRASINQPANGAHKPTILAHKPTTTSAPPSAPLSRPPTSLNRPRPNAPALPVAKPAPALAADCSAAGALALNGYPHPHGDNGRGLHWIPTTTQSMATVDRFVAEAQRMGIKWVTLLNNGANVGDNDYLVGKLVGAGIEPVMRL